MEPQTTVARWDEGGNILVRLSADAGQQGMLEEDYIVVATQPAALIIWFSSLLEASGSHPVCCFLTTSAVLIEHKRYRLVDRQKSAAWFPGWIGPDLIATRYI